MKIIATLALFFATIAHAQVGISPLVKEFGGHHAADSITVNNGSLLPVAVTIEAKTLTQVNGKYGLRDLDPSVTIKLKETSARIQPKSSRMFDFDVKCDRCAVVIFASITPIQKIKAEDHEMAVKMVYHFGETVYTCDKAKDCRASFTEAWKSIAASQPQAGEDAK